MLYFYDQPNKNQRFLINLSNTKFVEFKENECTLYFNDNHSFTIAYDDVYTKDILYTELSNKLSEILL